MIRRPHTPRTGILSRFIYPIAENAENGAFLFLLHTFTFVKH
jgi:hypothetical protein